MDLWKVAFLIYPRPDDDIQKVHGYSSAQLLDGRSLVLSLMIAASTVRACMFTRCHHHHSCCGMLSESNIGLRPGHNPPGHIVPIYKAHANIETAEALSELSLEWMCTLDTGTVMSRTP